MGLTGTSNTFLSLIEHMFVGITWNFSVHFLEDCLIFSKTSEEHITRLKQVFHRFREAKRKVKKSFQRNVSFPSEVQFLEYVISWKVLQDDVRDTKSI